MGNRALLLAALMTIGLFSRSVAQATVIYVDRDAQGANTGASWSDAFRDLQDALAVAVAGDEIWVAEGIYHPDRGSGDRFATFLLRAAVKVYGGFAGTEVSRDDRRPADRPTVLSGDLLENDASGARADNSLHVVTARTSTSDTLLDGFIVSGGSADVGDVGTEHRQGAGMFVGEGSLVLRGVIIKENIATGTNYFTDSVGGVGGGVLVTTGSPTFIDCVFVDNVAISKGGSGDFTGGGGLAVRSKPVVLIRVAFFRNRADGGNGGAILATVPQLTLDGCTFEANEVRGPGSYTRGYGGGLFADQAVFTDCSFSKNVAEAGAGAAAHDSTFVRCRFLQNVSNRGGGVFGGGRIEDCMFLGNEGGGLFGQGTIRRCSFLGNRGVGIGQAEDSIDVEGCVFSGNIAFGMIITASARVVNCTFFANRSVNGSHGGGLRCTLSSGGDRIFVSNSIFFRNEGVNGQQDELTQVDIPVYFPVNHCLVQSWTGTLLGDGTRNLHPLFHDPAGPDGLPGTLDDDLRLMPGSPAIDCGRNADVTEQVDRDGLPRRVDDDGTPDADGGAGSQTATMASASASDRVDLGPYEFQHRSPWTDLGESLPGTNGAPVLSVGGTLLPRDRFMQALSNAVTRRPTLLILGLSRIDVPAFGGTLVPFPDQLVKTTRTDAWGYQAVAWGAWPSGVPPHTPFYWQSWILDPGAPHGFAASNAVMGETP